MKSKQSNTPIQDSIKTNQLFWIYILISIFLNPVQYSIEVLI